LPEIVLYSIILFMLINHIAWIFLDARNTKILPYNLIYFISLTFPGIIAARIVMTWNAWQELIKNTEIVVVFISASILLATIPPIFGDFRIRGIGGTSYQTASYYSSMCFGILAYSTFRIDVRLRYRFLKSWIATLLNICLMFGLVICTFINGGRGAFILLTIYALLTIVWILPKGRLDFKALYRLFSVFFVLTISIFAIYKIILNNSFVAIGFYRAVSFIELQNRDLVNIESGSGGRDQVYVNAVRKIAASPLFGYGAFDHWNKTCRPHNIFLDLTLQFGIPIAVFFVFIFGSRFLHILTSIDSIKSWFLVILTYPSVYLMFSGSYLKESILWFCILSIFLYDKKVKNQRIHIIRCTTCLRNLQMMPWPKPSSPQRPRLNGASIR